MMTVKEGAPKQVNVSEEISEFLKKNQVDSAVRLSDGKNGWMGEQIGLADLNIERIAELGRTGCLFFQEGKAEVGKVIKAGKIIKTITSSQVRMGI
jgi:hypothetical protein